MNVGKWGFAGFVCDCSTGGIVICWCKMEGSVGGSALNISGCRMDEAENISVLLVLVATIGHGQFVDGVNCFRAAEGRKIGDT